MLNAVECIFEDCCSRFLKLLLHEPPLYRSSRVDLSRREPLCLYASSCPYITDISSYMPRIWLLFASMMLCKASIKNCWTTSCGGSFDNVPASFSPSSLVAFETLHFTISSSIAYNFRDIQHGFTFFIIDVCV